MKSNRKNGRKFCLGEDIDNYIQGYRVDLCNGTYSYMLVWMWAGVLFLVNFICLFCGFYFEVYIEKLNMLLQQGKFVK